jgi:hypothetical protein
VHIKPTAAFINDMHWLPPLDMYWSARRASGTQRFSPTCSLSCSEAVATDCGSYGIPGSNSHTGWTHYRRTDHLSLATPDVRDSILFSSAVEHPLAVHGQLT